MLLKFTFSSIVTIILFAAVNAQRSLDGISGGIINGSARYLPIPEYSQEAEDFCVGGKVEVLVGLMASGGKPLTVKAISGDELLYDSAEKAAKQAIFYSRQELRGDYKVKRIIVYNFPSGKKCINVGIVNKKALHLPKPFINLNVKIKQETIIKVGVIIDETGKVVFAKVLTPLHPLLRTAFETAAREAEFSYINDIGKIRIKAFLVYKLRMNGKVET